MFNRRFVLSPSLLSDHPSQVAGKSASRHDAGASIALGSERKQTLPIERTTDGGARRINREGHENALLTAEVGF
jgi:hypothetical protein